MRQKYDPYFDFIIEGSPFIFTFVAGHTFVVQFIAQKELKAVHLLKEEKELTVIVFTSIFLSISVCLCLSLACLSLPRLSVSLSL